MRDLLMLFILFTEVTSLNTKPLVSMEHTLNSAICFQETYLRRISTCLASGVSLATFVVASIWVKILWLMGGSTHADGVVINMVVGGEVVILRSIEEGCGIIIEEMPIHVGDLVLLSLTSIFLYSSINLSCQSFCRYQKFCRQQISCMTSTIQWRQVDYSDLARENRYNHFVNEILFFFSLHLLLHQNMLFSGSRDSSSMQEVTFSFIASLFSLLCWHFKYAWLQVVGLEL